MAQDRSEVHRVLASLVVEYLGVPIGMVHCNMLGGGPLDRRQHLHVRGRNRTADHRIGVILRSLVRNSLLVDMTAVPHGARVYAASVHHFSYFHIEVMYNHLREHFEVYVRPIVHDYAVSTL